MGPQKHRVAIIGSDATSPSPTRELVGGRSARQKTLLSARLLLDDEDPCRFEELLGELEASLKPAGAMEEVLVERVAIGIWRQQRLIKAETAMTALNRSDQVILQAIDVRRSRSAPPLADGIDLEPVDESRLTRCRAMLAEIEALSAVDLPTIEASAPNAWAQMLEDLAEAGETLETHLAHFSDGVDGWIVDVIARCQKELTSAEQRRKSVRAADLERSKRLVLPADVMELLARYQTTLDSQLYKALKALRDAQQWRLAMLEARSE